MSNGTIAALLAAAQLVEPLPPRSEDQVLLPIVSELFSSFGTSMVADGGHLIVGAPDQDAAGFNTGAIHTYLFANGSWQPRTMIAGSSSTLGYGRSLDLAGPTLIVARSGAGGDDVFVHRYNPAAPSEWPIVQQIPPTPPAPGTRSFAKSVALEGDTLFIGDGFLDSNHLVRVFERAGANQPFVHVDNLTTPPGFVNGGRFGDSLDTSPGLLAVGGTGDVWLFAEEGGSWQVLKHLPNAGFDGAVRLREGVLAAVGPGGTVEVFERDLGGPNAWGLAASLAPPSGSNGFFGHDIRLDDHRLYVSMPGLFLIGTVVGRVFVYRREVGDEDQPIWRFEQVIMPGFGTSNFGTQIALHEGQVLVSDQAFDNFGAVHVGTLFPADLTSALPVPGH